MPRVLQFKRSAVGLILCGSLAVAASAEVTVSKGDTLWSIAHRSGTTVAKLELINGVQDGHIRIGQTLKLPATRSASAPVIARASAKTAAVRAKVSVTTVQVRGVIWPLRGQITSPFGISGYIRTRGTRLHTGIDIAAPIGTPVRAAVAGRVTKAGWDTSGYGQLVVIQGIDGRAYYYGHNSRMLVSVGQAVSQGGLISLVGSTGNSTGPHLHFEVRVRDVPINPMLLLSGSVR